MLRRSPRLASPRLQAKGSAVPGVPRWPSGWILLAWGRPLGTVRSIRLAVDLHDDRTVHDPIQKRHRQRRITEVLTPRLEIDVRHQRRRPLRAPGIDQLVQQARRLARFAAFDPVEAELVEDQQVELRVLA